MRIADCPQFWQPPLVVSAGFPDEEYAVPSAELLTIEEALLSLVRAALAQGRQLILPADPVVAPLVADMAAEYAEPARTEGGERPPRRVLVLFSEGRNDGLAEVLAPLTDVQLQVPANVGEADRPRQRLIPDAVRSLEPAAGIVFGGATESLDDFWVLQHLKLPIYVIGSSLVGPLRESADLREYDIVERILGEIGWGRRDNDVVADAELVVPYPYVMQSLIAELGPIL